MLLRSSHSWFLLTGYFLLFKLVHFLSRLLDLSKLVQGSVLGYAWRLLRLLPGFNKLWGVCGGQVLHLLLFRVLQKGYDEQLLEFLRLDEHLVDAGDDLVDYEVRSSSHQFAFGNCQNVPLCAFQPSRCWWMLAGVSTCSYLSLCAKARLVVVHCRCIVLLQLLHQT